MLRRLMLLTTVFFYSSVAFATSGQSSSLSLGSLNQSQEFSVSLQILAIMTLLSFLPALLMTMTSFTRIAIVLSILRQAIGLTQSPSNQIIIGISLFLSLFVMSPVFEQVYTNALTPLMEKKITQQQALKIAEQPFKKFMLHQTREGDLALFLRLSGEKQPKELMSTPMKILMPAFLISELKTAFQIGFIIFVPFLIIDIVIASILMSMGMMMLSPLIISLPFKIMFFVLVDGWNLVLGMLAASFGG